MIRREEQGRYLLIRQDDHARLSGDLARQFGNDRFESLGAPNAALGEQAILGITMHDAGWPLHDDAPSINPKQQPRDVFESKTDQAIRVWPASAERAMQASPYAGLLVSLHGLALSVFALTDVMHQFSRKNVAYTRDRFELNKFQHNEIERQQTLRGQLGLRSDLPLKYGLADLRTDPKEDLLSHHFRLLQAMDKLSLALCCTRPPFETLDIANKPGDMLHRVKLKRAEPRKLLIDPWIFGPSRVTASVSAKVLPVQPYPSDAALLTAYQAAPIETLDFVLEPGA